MRHFPGSRRQPYPHHTHTSGTLSLPSQGVFKLKNLVANTEETAPLDRLEDTVLETLAGMPARRAIFTFNSVKQPTDGIKNLKIAE